MSRFFRSVLGACVAFAAASGPALAINLIPTYCADNPRVGTECSKSREQAETHIKEDPSPGYGRWSLKPHEWNTPFGSGNGSWIKYATPMIPWVDHDRTWYLGTIPFGGGTIQESCGGNDGCASEAALEQAIDGSPDHYVTGTHYPDPPSSWQALGSTGKVFVDYTRPLPEGRQINYDDGASIWHVHKQAHYVCPEHFWGWPPGGFRINFAVWPDTCSNDETGQITSGFRQSEHCEAGNPCVPGNGGKTAHETDFEWEGLTFQRHYHSIRDYTADVALGPGWSHTFGWRLHENSGNNYFVDVLSDRLTMEVFDRIDSTTVFRSMNRTDQVLTRAGNPISPTWTLHLGGGETRHFDSAGRLTAMRWADQPQRNLTLDYCTVAEFKQAQCTAAGQLHTVTSARGRTLTFVYAATPEGDLSAPARLAYVTSDGGVLAAYDYDAQARLVARTFPQDDQINAVRTYLYNEPDHVCKDADGSPSPDCTFTNFPYHLTGIIDENAVRFADYTYDDYGRVTRSVHAGGADLHTLDYRDAWTTWLTLPSGGVRKYAFAKPSDIFAKPVSVQQGDEEAAYTYHPDGRLKTVSNPNAAVSEYEYNSTYPTAVIEAKNTPEQRRRETDWNTSTHRPAETRVRNAANTLVERRTYAYNARGQVSSVTQIDPVNAATRTTTYTYCEADDLVVPETYCPLLGLLRSVDGPRNDVDDDAGYLYYSTTDLSGCFSAGPCHRKGDVWKVVNALGHEVETLRYDQHGRAIAIRDANGVVTELAYHPRGWLISRTVLGASPADSAVTAFEYDATGLVTRVTQPDGSWLAYEYDEAHRLVAIEDALGNRIDYTLDVAGNRTAELMKDPNGVVTRSLSRVYDTLGRLEQQLDAYSQATQFTHDLPNRTTSTIDPLNTETRQDYDPLDRLKRTLQDVGGLDVETQFAYDALDRLTQVTDPKTLPTTYTYDGLGNLTALSSPDTGLTQSTYDSAGNRLTQTDARGITVSSTYDALNRLTSLTYPTSSLNTTYVYDQLPNKTCSENYLKGRLVRMIDGSGSTIYCYDRRGNITRKKQIVGPLTLTVNYTWTKSDRLQSILYPSGTAVIFERDAAGNVVSISRFDDAEPGEIADNVTYVPFGPLTSAELMGPATLEIGYDANYAADAIGGSALDLDFEVDARGNITGADAPGTQRTFHYDNLSRLTEMADQADVTLEAFSYDETGNRLSKERGGLQEAYGYPPASHRLTTIGPRAMTYNAAGSLTNRGDGYTFEYNDAHRLSTVRLNGAMKLQNLYNAKGERVAKVPPNSPSTKPAYFFYDESGHLLAEYLTSPLGTVTLQREYVWLEDRPIAVRVAAGAYAEQTLAIHTDHLGTPRAITSEAGTPVWTWALGGSAFGEHAPNEDPDQDQVAFKFNLRYPGQYFDSESGLHYNYFRDYDSTVARYLQPEPNGVAWLMDELGENWTSQDTSLYSYVANDPLTWMDLDGQKKYKTPPNPNKKPPPDHRKPSGQRERNVKHPNGEEHSIKPKGGSRLRVPFPAICILCRIMYSPEELEHQQDREANVILPGTGQCK